MSDERRYSEREIAAIFREATEAQEAAQRARPHGEGLTLAELQQIGHEAGITPAFIARAAATVDRKDSTPPPPTHLGLPIGVARTVELPGPFSEADWDRLVVDLRATFGATGVTRREGGLREWRNGNLHALVEPTESGHRLHLSTRKGNAPSRLTGGLVFFVMGLVFMLIGLMTGRPFVDPDTLVLAMFAAVGLGGAGLTAYQLSRWVGERDRQMESLAVRALERAGASPVATSDPVAAGAATLDLDQRPEEMPTGSSQTTRRTRA